MPRTVEVPKKKVESESMSHNPSSKTENNSDHSGTGVSFNTDSKKTTVTDTDAKANAAGAKKPKDKKNVNTDPDAIEEDDVVKTEKEFETIDTSFSKKPTKSTIKGLLTNMSKGIFGMPYQYPEIVDTRLEGSEFGRKYIEKFVSTMPVMFITPGEPKFLEGYDKKDKSNLLNYVANTDGADPKDALSKVDGSVPFYSFNSKFEEYCKYVNTMVVALAKLMKVEKITGVKIDSFDLRKYLNKDFAGMFNAHYCIPLYVDSESSVSESFSNSTSESSIGSTINSVSDKAREIEFLMGSVGAGKMFDDLKGTVADVGSAIMGVTSKFGIGEGIAAKLTNGVMTVVNGGKIIFPEIWSGSDFSRSYSISMKLRTPDPDPYSILMNLYLPYIMIFCLGLPRQIGSDANGYRSPFLIRATYKSIFNCELGIISNISVTKGGEDKWNGIGMPTTMDISFDIKDLYSTMFISKSIKGIMNNVAQLDYVSLMAGIDMNKDWVARRAYIMSALVKNRLTNIFTGPWYSFKSGLNNTASGFLSKALGVDTRF